ncbi:DsbC family protein [Ideonella sp. B7]|uniref:DsbC family protein n=1 Tax=Ideonella benzenivorans TaxID=2831643 RepID=UPI001CEC2C46|nr:DsbC family protein [Ideonella benzenivorans]MCA6216868.1 DsbC family protein [Ideonella benzenivorans]
MNVFAFAPVSVARGAAALTLTGLALSAALADEAAIRKNLAERMPGLPKIDEISKGPIPGLYEVRLGTDILYTDEQGNHVIEGSIYDTRTHTDLTKARVDKLTAIDFAQLPLKDALVMKQGNGSRKLAVFADPNCGYCKRLEKDLVALKDVTIYTFVIPILGPDSSVKARDIWCAKDSAQVWRNWMVSGRTPPKAMGGKCDTAAIERNLALSRKYKVTGTPALVFEDGTRVPGAISAGQIEKQLASARKS